MKRIFLFLFFLFIAVAPAFAKTDPREVMVEVRKSLEQADEASEVKMTLIDERGQQSDRRLSLWQSFRASGDLSRVKFTSPAHMRDLQLLSRGDEQYLKPPDIKPRKIAFREKGLAFAQSEFFYEDLEGWRLDDYSYSLFSESGDRIILDAAPRKESSYQDLRITVDNKKNVILGIEFFNKQRRLWKTQTNLGFVQATTAVWRPSRTEMVNHLNGRKTIVEIISRKFQRIPERIFSLGDME